MGKSASKTKKHRRTEDRISGLSDELLIHILSFLPIKEAVATSFLSKRWRGLWLSLPTLQFNRQTCRSLRWFYRFADQVLKSVDLKSVKKFVLEFAHFHYNEHFSPRKISKWIDNVVTNSEVEHLEIDMKEWAYQLPSIVFTANNIRFLKLKDVKMGTLSHVNLPLLEVLHLEHVNFSDVRSLEMLLSSCPLLKDLVLKNLYGNLNLPLNIGGLNHMVTAEVPQCLLPLKVLSNVTFLRLYWTPDMWSFTDDVPMFHNLTHLECVAGEWTKMVNRLRNFPKLEKLVVSERPFYHEVDTPSPLEPIRDVPPCVSLHLKEFTIRYFQGPEWVETGQVACQRPMTWPAFSLA
ncbi:putative FBD-associated F-box protein At5g56410 [Neltuma alba]|uniref:putative FBD-associated F-box protein At5g56410 n=1 Tax=Neltuma alba TaxID=207710 RepID=UPI0010A3F70D|nr:putative FBD-associated F-box protein At5g56410 [Prosopis alba]